MHREAKVLTPTGFHAMPSSSLLSASIDFRSHSKIALHTAIAISVIPSTASKKEYSPAILILQAVLFNDYHTLFHGFYSNDN